MLKIYADYHTHTYYSDGKSTIEDNVKIAIARGLKTIGISDHGYKHYYFGVKYDNYAKIRAEIDALKEKYKNIVKGSLRSKQRVDCNQIAKHFGGGGHIRAAGFTINDINIEDAKKLVLDYVKNYV